jgi:hypothetical protein
MMIPHVSLLVVGRSHGSLPACDRMESPPGDLLLRGRRSRYPRRSLRGPALHSSCRCVCDRAAQEPVPNASPLLIGRYRPTVISTTSSRPSPVERIVRDRDGSQLTAWWSEVNSNFGAVCTRQGAQLWRARGSLRGGYATEAGRSRTLRRSNTVGKLDRAPLESCS